LTKLIFIDGKIKFEGIKKRIRTTALTDASLTSLKPGKSIHVHLDLATAHDLTTGGAFSALSAGQIPFAEQHSNKLAGAIHYTSNNVTLTIDKHAASKLKAPKDRPRKSKTSQISDCGSNQDATNIALTECNWLATSAGYQALNGDAEKYVSTFN
jgi:deuterolysin